MSGRSSVSTFTGTKSLFSRAATCASAYVVSSITWHQWHHTAPMSIMIGRFSDRASASVCGLHGCHRIALDDASRRYMLGADFSAPAGSALAESAAKLVRTLSMQRSAADARIVRVDFLLMAR